MSIYDICPICEGFMMIRDHSQGCPDEKPKQAEEFGTELSYFDENPLEDPFVMNISNKVDGSK